MEVNRRKAELKAGESGPGALVPQASPNLIEQLVDKRETVAFLQELVRIDSVNPPGNEAAVATAMADRLDHPRLHLELVDLGAGRANLVARLRGKDECPGLLLLGHTDTVPVGAESWTRDPFGAEIAEGRLYGRGASDMKGGLVAAAVALRALAESGVEPTGDVVLAAVAGEEVDCFGSRALLQASGLGGLGGIVVAEPTSLGLFVAHKGAVWVRLRASGRGAHGSMPELGANAIQHLADLIARRAQLVRSDLRHPLLGAPTVSVGTIAGGAKTNVVADFCEATLDFRILPGQSRDDVLAAIAAVHNQLADSGVALEIEVVNDRAPVVTTADAPLIQAAARVASEVLGAVAPGAVQFGSAAYYTDLSVLVPPSRLPALICGPGEPDQAHVRDEWVAIDKVVVAARFYADLALEL
ncbi:MAG: M20 family metallopeptidase, partial [Chloroflexi bacterium]|nr:M20 family metallopeptidase [Chloroflexota bacterium]